MGARFMEIAAHKQMILAVCFSLACNPSVFRQRLEILLPDGIDVGARIWTSPGPNVCADSPVVDPSRKDCLTPLLAF
jgi:hypothetical protein